MRARLRNLGPRSGPPYELFDCAVFLLILGGIGYLLTVPPSTSRDALAFVYHVLPARFWGWGLVLTALVSIASSYHDAWVRRGLLLMQIVCIFWAGCFALGALGYAVLVEADRSLIRSAISVVLYTWIASRMGRELDRWDAQKALLASQEPR